MDDKINKKEIMKSVDLIKDFQYKWAKVALNESKRKGEPKAAIPIHRSNDGIVNPPTFSKSATAISKELKQIQKENIQKAQRVKYYIGQGMNHFLNEQYSSASICFKNVIHLEPDNNIANSYLSKIEAIKNKSESKKAKPVEDAQNKAPNAIPIITQTQKSVNLHDHQNNL